MATNKNDDRILGLRAKIDTQREDLKSRPSRFSPITTCSLSMGGKTTNIHTLQKSELEFLACELQALVMAGAALKLTASVSGFTVDEWLRDVTQRLAVMETKAEQTKLKALEEKLNGLLSGDKKTELELDSIEGML